VGAEYPSNNQGADQGLTDAALRLTFATIGCKKFPPVGQRAGLQVGFFPIKKPTEQQVSQHLLVWLKEVMAFLLGAATRPRNGKEASRAGCMGMHTTVRIVAGAN